MQFYCQCATILRTIETEQQGFQQVIFSQKSQENFPKQYAIMSSVVQNLKLLNEMEQYLSNKCSIENEYLLKILLHEVFIRPQKIKLGGKLMKFIKKHKQNIQDKFSIQLSQLPNKLIKQFKYFRTLPQISQEKLNLIQQSAKKDDIINNLYEIDYENYSKFNKEYFELYKDPHIVIQSKSSCLPVYAIKKVFPDIKGVILESCSSPGNKTLQIREYFPENKIYSFELDPKRFAILQKRMQFYENSLINKSNLVLGDFFECKEQINTEEVELIILDPSCSGSGMLSNILNIQNIYQGKDMKTLFSELYKNQGKKQKSKIEDLALNQEKFIQFCIDNFKNLKGISYSTCSIYKRENEQVVRNILLKNKNIELIHIEDYPIRGIDFWQDQIGKEMIKCVRETFEQKKTDGFFVAIFKVINQIGQMLLMAKNAPKIIDIKIKYLIIF